MNYICSKKDSVMSVQEQESLKEKYYGEAVRYMDNTKNCLKKAKKEDNYYQDPKYVKMVCGTAYCGILVALDYFLILKGIDNPKGKSKKSIEYYQENIIRIDEKMLGMLNSIYKVLHLLGYYDGITSVKVLNEGFIEAYKIIEKIRPAMS